MDTLVRNFQDSIMPRLNYVLTEYNRKLQDLGDSANFPASVRAQILKESAGIQRQSWITPSLVSSAGIPV